MSGQGGRPGVTARFAICLAFRAGNGLRGVSEFTSENRLALTLCLLALVALLSLLPAGNGSASGGPGRLIDRIPVLFQKIMHVCLYAVLSFLLVSTLEGIAVVAWRYVIAFIAASGFGALMEWCQTKVPGRFGTLADVGLNAAGAAIGLLAASLLLHGLD